MPVETANGLTGEFNEAAQDSGESETPSEEDEGGEEAEDPPELNYDPPWKPPPGPRP